MALSPPAFSQSVFRSDSRVVEVPLVATRADGSLVEDLRKEEIRVFDNNREQAIVSFEGVGARLAGVASNPSTRRLTIIVLDVLNTSWCSQSYGQDAVSEVLAKLPQRAAKIAIFALGDDLQLLHDFSNDSASLRQAVDGWEGDQPFIGVDQDQQQDHPGAPLCPHSTPAKPAGPVAEFHQEMRVSQTLDAMRTIGRRMRDFQGEKSLLWVSEAFPPPPAHQELERAMHELAIAKVRLYPVDPEGLLGGSGIGTMMELAEPTGGRVFYGSNDTTALVQAAMDDSQEGYVLTFAPADYREDGSFHDLRLKTSRKGVELTYRPGYTASPNGR